MIRIAKSKSVIFYSGALYQTVPEQPANLIEVTYNEIGPKIARNLQVRDLAPKATTVLSINDVLKTRPLLWEN